MVTVGFTVPDSVLREILTGAVEGGSAFWLAADSVTRGEDGDVVSINGPLDAEEGGAFDGAYFRSELGFATGDITPATVLRGLQVIAAAGKFPRLVGQIMRIPSGDHDFDAGDYDLIVQVGFFGEVVFG